MKVRLHAPESKPHPPGRAPRMADEKGMALILTLMVVAVITAMVVEFAYGVYTSTSSLYNWQLSQKLSLAAKSAVKLSSVLISRNVADFSSNGSFEAAQKIPYEDPDGTITLRIDDENAKFNLRTLKGLRISPDPDKDPYNAFVRLLDALELPRDIADRVSYWLDSGSAHRPPDPAAVSKNAPLDSVDELLLIPGIDAGSYAKLRPYVTIYGDTKIDVNAADVPVLMSLSSSITKEIAQRIVAYRENALFSDAALDQKIIGIDKMTAASLQGYITLRGNSYRVVATAESSGIKRIIETVLDGGVTVRYWRET